MNEKVKWERYVDKFPQSNEIPIYLNIATILPHKSRRSLSETKLFVTKTTYQDDKIIDAKIVKPHEENAELINSTSETYTKDEIEQVKESNNSTVIKYTQSNKPISYYRKVTDGCKHFFKWIWVGSKDFGTNINTSYKLIRNTLQGYTLTYSEHKLLVRTMTDVIKLVPFSMFLIIPFAELALPLVLRLFPNMLPSTFNKEPDKSALGKRLRAKAQLATFFQEVLVEKSRDADIRIKAKKKLQGDIISKAHDLEQQKIPSVSSFSSVWQNTPATYNDVVRFANIHGKLFDLDNMSVVELQTLAKLLSISAFSMKSHLVLSLRHRFRQLRYEDRILSWEGVDQLSDKEIREACRDRGISYLGEPRTEMVKKLQEYLLLARNPAVPTPLIIWTRSFCISRNDSQNIGSKEH